MGENVRGLVNWNGGLVFEEVCVDLKLAGYSVQPLVLPVKRVSTLPTEETECGLLLTPTTREDVTDKDKFKERMEKYDNGTTVPNLATQVVDMLPTPTKFDYNTPRSQEAWDNAKEKHGDALQNPLKQMAYSTSLTPVATDVEGGAVSNVQNDGKDGTGRTPRARGGE